jgi:hypothetical protein
VNYAEGFFFAAVCLLLLLLLCVCEKNRAKTIPVLSTIHSFKMKLIVALSL